jgi:DMSO reductase family type II enzyme heme b subunit
MSRTARARIGALAVTAVLGVVGATAAWRQQPSQPSQPAPGVPAQSGDAGRAVYEKWCAGCHGLEGRGDGPGARHLLPKPRDFTRALYQVRTTATGELPTDEDIRRVVDEGMPGTSMPGWRARLSSSERDAVMRYIKSFAAAFATPPTPLRFAGNPGGGQDAIDSGRALYRRIECWKCHGEQGRGDGRSSPTLKDDFGNPIRAVDLTQNWTFNGGGEVEDIYRRLRSGLDGTPMPSFSDLIEGNIITEDDLWRVAAYVRSLSPDEAPRVRDVVGAARVAAVPAGPDDSAWAEVERAYLPLVGQVIVRPRQFASAVNGVWVQAVHDGRTLALRVSWHDASRSPGAAWNVWRGRMARVMGSDDSAAAPDTASPLPDRLAVQFPTRLHAGGVRPYFLMGNAEQPVYLWRWESEPGAATEAVARGAGQEEPLPPQPDSVTAAGVYDQGEWRVQFVRALSVADSTNRLQLVSGEAIPMAVYVWDGSNGESGTRMAVGSWVAIYLGEPARAGTYVWPLLAVLITGAAGVLVIARAQRMAGTSSQPEVAPAEAV